jgi:hypothetical protein
MRYVALTGISPYVLKELQDNYIRTIEIRSPHNFLSIQAVESGDLVFLTKSSYDDIKTGTIGTIAGIKERQIAMHRIVHKTEDFFEESETFAARLQLELQGLGRVRRVEQNMLGKPLIVEADKVTYLEAR